MHELLDSTALYLQDLATVSIASMGRLTRMQTAESFTSTARASSGTLEGPSSCMMMPGICGSDQADTVFRRSFGSTTTRSDTGDLTRVH